MDETMSEQQQQENQAETDFEAGFTGEQSPAGLSVKPDQPQETTPEGTEQQAAAEEAPTVAGLSEEQVRSLLAKASEFDSIKEELRKLNGRYGELKSNLQQIGTAPKGAGKISKESLKKLSAFNPELAEALAEDLSGAIAPQEINWDEQLAPRLKDMERKLEMDLERKALLRQHKDFYDQIETPDFKLWLGQQSAEAQKEWGESIDSDYLAGKMTAFKEWRANLSNKQNKQRRLETAVKPQGTQVAEGGMTDEQAFEAGFYGR